MDIIEVIRIILEALTMGGLAVTLATLRAKRKKEKAEAEIAFIVTV